MNKCNNYLSKIFTRHHLNPFKFLNPIHPGTIGAEWWMQVKISSTKKLCKQRYFILSNFQQCANGWVQVVLRYIKSKVEKRLSHTMAHKENICDLQMQLNILWKYRLFLQYPCASFRDIRYNIHARTIAHVLRDIQIVDQKNRLGGSNSTAAHYSRIEQCI